MPQAIPLPRTSKFVLIAMTDRFAPRTEPMRTTEVKGKKRYGEGRLYRVAGRVAVGVGQWTEPPDVEKIRKIEGIAEGEFSPHLINDEQFEQLRARFADVNNKKLREGWTPPVWHWRHYQEFLLPWLHKLRLIETQAYGDVHLRRPSWWPVKTTTDAWRPMTVAEDMPTMQEDDSDAVGA